MILFLQCTTEWLFFFLYISLLFSDVIFFLAVFDEEKTRVFLKSPRYLFNTDVIELSALLNFLVYESCIFFRVGKLIFNRLKWPK